MRTKENVWFAHDCLDQNTPAMSAMLLKYKGEGYGWWWILMEILRVDDEYRFNITTSFAYDVLARRFMTTEAKAKEFITSLIGYYEMLQTDGVYIWCDKLCKRMEVMEQKKEKLRKAGSKGGNTKKQNRIDAEKNKEAEQLQQKASDATPMPQHFVAHNNTIHNNTEHNNTEQNSTVQNTTKQNKTVQNSTATKQNSEIVVNDVAVEDFLYSVNTSPPGKPRFLPHHRSTFPALAASVSHSVKSLLGPRHITPRQQLADTG